MNLRTAMSAAGAAVVLLAGCGGRDDSVRTMPASQCIRYSDYAYVRSSLDTPASARRAARSGEVLFVADGTSGVQVVDIGDPDRPVIVGSVTSTSVVVDVLVDNGRLYVGTTSNGVAMFSLDDNRNPSYLGGDPLAGQCLGMAIRDTLLYVADNAIGLQVVNVADPSNPVPGNAESTPGSAQDVVLTPTHVFVSDNVLGLRSIALVTPTTPVLSTTLPLTGNPQGMARRDSILYIAAGGQGVHVVSIGDPDRPIIVGRIPSPGGPSDVDIGASGRLFVADRYIGMSAYTTDDPYNPRLAFTMNTRGEVRGVDLVNGDYLAVSDGLMGIHLLQHPSSADVPVETTVPGSTSWVELIGDAIYLGSSTGSIEVLEAPAKPVTTVPQTATTTITSTGDLAWVAGSGFITALEVTNPFAPIVGPTATVTGDVNRLDAADSVVYAVFGIGGLEVYTAGADGALTFGSAIFTGQVFFDVVAAGTLAFVAAGTGGLRVVDASFPAGAREIGAAQADGPALSVAMMDGYALVGLASGGMQVFDVTNPRFPSSVASLRGTGQPWRIDARDGLAYLAEGPAGMIIVDLSVPASPVVTGMVPTVTGIFDVTTSPSFVYAADDGNGLIVTRIPCSTTP